MDELARLRAIVEGMTPGPWETLTAIPGEYQGEGHPELRSQHDGEMITAYPGGIWAETDARGIALLRNVASELIAVAEAALLMEPHCRVPTHYMRHTVLSTSHHVSCPRSLHDVAYALRARLRELLPSEETAPEEEEWW